MCGFGILLLEFLLLALVRPIDKEFFFFCENIAVEASKKMQILYGLQAKFLCQCLVA
jgi:hypothetical protein